MLQNTSTVFPVRFSQQETSGSRDSNGPLVAFIKKAGVIQRHTRGCEKLTHVTVQEVTDPHATSAMNLYHKNLIWDKSARFSLECISIHCLRGTYCEEEEAKYILI